MPGETNNVNVVCEQAYTPNPNYRVNLKRAAENNGYYKIKNTLFQLQIDKNGRITKVTQSKIGYTQNGQIVLSKEATLFDYNENGDITRQIYDDSDDGQYEYVYDFDCVYDKDNKLATHEETLWSKIRNGYRSFVKNMPINN